MTKNELEARMKQDGISIIPLGDCGKVVLDNNGLARYDHSHAFRYYTADEYAYKEALARLPLVVRTKQSLDKEARLRVDLHHIYDTWEYADADGVVRHHTYPRQAHEIKADIWCGTYDQIFERVERENNRLRYCNGTYYKFGFEEDEAMFRIWQATIPSSRSFDLYYGDGIVD